MWSSFQYLHLCKYVTDIEYRSVSVSTSTTELSFKNLYGFTKCFLPPYAEPLLSLGNDPIKISSTLIRLQFYHNDTLCVARLLPVLVFFVSSLTFCFNSHDHCSCGEARETSIHWNALKKPEWRQQLFNTFNNHHRRRWTFKRKWVCIEFISARCLSCRYLLHPPLAVITNPAHRRFTTSSVLSWAVPLWRLSSWASPC